MPIAGMKIQEAREIETRNEMRRSKLSTLAELTEDEEYPMATGMISKGKRMGAWKMAGRDNPPIERTSHQI
ncbi:hypothetical protein Nepgr_007539 [Nepenthes gracilis]|uniref:Uncharacterized protein n=1 Tax=Nepenthes gracilis TaxID=150966 RepID=A0AAD3XIF6_NEPGR|nr:hypothetical protein Nepgr_007539 [Nepenthes gracilis]